MLPNESHPPEKLSEESAWRVEQERASYERKYKDLRTAVIGLVIAGAVCLLWYVLAQ